MDTRRSRDHLIHQLEGLERQVASLRTQLLPEPSVEVREAFTGLGVEVDGSFHVLPIAEIQRVIPLVSWRPLPESPSWVLGVFRYRGQTLMLVDLHRRFCADEIPLSPAMVIIVTRAPEAVGLVATSVTRLIHVEPRDITAPPTDVSYAPFITGSIAGPGGAIMHLLSVPRLRRELSLELGSERAWGEVDA